MDNKKTSKLGIYGMRATESQDFYTLSIQQNEYRINAVSGILDLFLPIGAAIIYILNATGVFILDSRKVGLVFIVMLPFAVASFVVTHILKKEKPWVKYLLLADECIIVLMLFSVLSMHVVMILVLPVLKATLYFNKRVMWISFAMSSFCILAGHILSVYLSIVFDDPIVSSMYASLVYGFIPRFVEYIAIFIVVMFITRNSSQMQADGYAYAARAGELLEKNRTNHYEIVKNLATISENKSVDSGAHVQRVFEYMRILAKCDGAGDEEAYNIGLAAMLHDVGKLAIDEKILSKPGRLTPEEREMIKPHARLGRELLSGSDNEVIKLAGTIAYEHHERWDGKGYYGIKGEDLNKYSCLMSIADVFDALVSKRCYKDAWSIEDAYNEIVNGRGTAFAPFAVDMFIKCFDEFKAVCEKYKE